MEIRPADRGDRRRRTIPHWTAAPKLRIRTFGRMVVESREGKIAGEWLDQRPGQVLRLLLCERRRILHTDAIAEAIWPGAGPGGAGNVRYMVHALRQWLEPGRAKRSSSSFVVSRGGGYVLNRETVSVDADDFDRLVGIGLSAHARGAREAASSALHAAVAMYEGEFLADEPYAEWVLGERQRLQKRACDALGALADMAIAEHDLKGATSALERLCELLPYDLAIHRRFIASLLEAGQQSDAAAAYQLLQTRMVSVFGDELDFALSEVSASEAYEPQD
jgi:DNA-binding SARP family transcriptional activator